MNISNITYQKTTLESAYLFSDVSENILNQNSGNKSSISKLSNDKLNLSKETEEIKQLGLNLTGTNIIKENSNTSFEYNFSDGLIQVQSKGNFDSKTNTGKIEITFELGKALENRSDKISILPKEVKITLDFSMFEHEIKQNNENAIKTSDLLSASIKMLKNIVEPKTSEQNQDIKQLGTEIKSLYDFVSNLSKGKFSQKILEWLFTLSKTKNPNVKSSDSNQSTIMLPAEEINTQIDNRSISIKMENIQVEVYYNDNTKTS